MKIVQSKNEEAKHIAHIISKANKEVATLFNITKENTPKHPSFYTTEWVLSDIKRGEQYFLYKDDGIIKGCVAFEHPDSETAYLNRLAVLPGYRHKGIGATLVKHICEYSKSKEIQTVSIGIIAEHTVLKNWYLDIGFIAGDTKRFDHLPFNVLFLHYDL